MASKVAPKILVLYYSTYGHIQKLAETIAAGAKAAGAEVDIYQVPETLSSDILAKMHAPPKPDYPIFEDVTKFKNYDGFAFGIPTRYGRAPAQWSALFDKTGGLWMSGALVGKFATIFSSTAGQHGGQETTAFTTIPFLVHQGISFVPIGYATPELNEMNEVSGGAPWGASTLASSNGSRLPSENELKIATYQGKYFAEQVGFYVTGKAASA